MSSRHNKARRKSELYALFGRQPSEENDDDVEKSQLPVIIINDRHKARRKSDMFAMYGRQKNEEKDDDEHVDKMPEEFAQHLQILQAMYGRQTCEEKDDVENVDKMPAVSKLQKAATVSFSPELTQIYNRLTQKQKEILKETFKEMDLDPAGNGMAIFLKLFHDFPSFKNVFPKFACVGDWALYMAPALRSHGIVFMGTLREIITRLDDELALFGTLVRIARTHRLKGVTKRHIKESVSSVLQIVKKTNGETELSYETIQAWTTLFDVLAALIEEFKEDSIETKRMLFRIKSRSL